MAVFLMFYDVMVMTELGKLQRMSGVCNFFKLTSTGIWKKNNEWYWIQKKKVYIEKHKYRLEFKEDPVLKKCIKPSKKWEHFFFCNVCGVDCKGGKSAVNKQNSSSKYSEESLKVDW